MTGVGIWPFGAIAQRIIAKPAILALPKSATLQRLLWRASVTFVKIIDAWHKRALYWRT